jgi:hypothetical protein
MRWGLLSHVQGRNADASRVNIPPTKPRSLSITADGVLLAICRERTEGILVYMTPRCYAQLGARLGAGVRALAAAPLSRRS